MIRNGIIQFMTCTNEDIILRRKTKILKKFCHLCSNFCNIFKIYGICIILSTIYNVDKTFCIENDMKSEICN